MKTRTLGTQGLEVSAMGLGCMGMSDFYGPSSDTKSRETLLHALELGVTFWDTADMYGLGANERLLGTVLAEHRQDVTLATKFGVIRNDAGEFVGVNSRPEYVREACEASLRRLGTDHIDLYYLHRMAPDVPIEETVGAMSRLVEEGKISYLGLSEVSSETLQRAATVHPITALQYEYSLWTREIENGILQTCRELGIGVVAYSPMGRGFLTGQLKSRNDLPEGDWRLSNPRFAEKNFKKNRELAAAFETMAQEKGCTPAQLALAWLLSQGDDIVPIPGTRRIERLEENLAAINITVTPQEREHLDTILPPDAAAGERY